jgi:hypothetical protein
MLLVIDHISNCLDVKSLVSEVGTTAKISEDWHNSIILAPNLAMN